MSVGKRLDLFGVSTHEYGVDGDAVAICQGHAPCSRIANIERIRCWFIPMRPVTPCMMTPSRVSATGYFSG